MTGENLEVSYVASMKYGRLNGVRFYGTTDLPDLLVRQKKNLGISEYRVESMDRSALPLRASAEVNLFSYEVVPIMDIGKSAGD